MDPRPHVLLATPDNLTMSRIAAALEENGFSFIASRSGSDAYSRLTTPGGPRVAILDTRLDTIDGIEICRRVRSKISDQYTYCLLLNASNETKASLVGADAVVHPPFEPKHLVNRLHSMLRIDNRQPRLVEDDLPSIGIDPATGVWDAKTIQQHFEATAEQLKNRRGCLATIRVRLDRFDRVDREYGATSQRVALRCCARRIRDQVRACEGMGRIGSAEFLIVIEGNDPNAPTHVAERIRTSINSNPVRIGDELLPMSISVGVAVVFSAHEALNLMRWTACALHEASFSGGDRVVEWLPLGHRASA